MQGWGGRRRWWGSLGCSFLPWGGKWTLVSSTTGRQRCQLAGGPPWRNRADPIRERGLWFGRRRGRGRRWLTRLRLLGCSARFAPWELQRGLNCPLRAGSGHYWFSVEHKKQRMKKQDVEINARDRNDVQRSTKSWEKTIFTTETCWLLVKATQTEACAIQSKPFV